MVFTVLPEISWKDEPFEKADSPEGIAVVADISPFAAPTVAAGTHFVEMALGT